MELILQGWLDTHDGELSLKSSNYDSYWSYQGTIAELIMNYFNYTILDSGLGVKITMVPNANLRIWFSDEECSLEEAQMNLESYMITGDLLTEGHYIGYSEWTITGFDIDRMIIGGHDLNSELRDHIGQYVHIILTD